MPASPPCIALLSHDLRAFVTAKMSFVTITVQFVPIDSWVGLRIELSLWNSIGRSRRTSAFPDDQPVLSVPYNSCNAGPSPCRFGILTLANTISHLPRINHQNGSPDVGSITCL